MTEIKIFIQPDQVYTEPIRYALGLLANTSGVSFLFVTHATEAEFIYDHSKPGSLPIEIDYWQAIGDFDWQKAHRLFLSREEQESLGAIFHLSNCIQEYDSPDTDVYGRYKFTASWQSKEGNMESNVVQTLMTAYLRKYMRNQDFPAIPSKIFLSHDIDTIHGEFLQDGFAALKSGRLDLLASIVYHFFAGKPGWINMDVINKMHDDHGVKHSFFWIINRIKANGIKNADYTLGELKKYSSNCHSNGLHKSSADMTYNEELAMLPSRTASNRNHFLRFKFPEHWKNLSESDVKVDCSLGFAEHYGFRNSYGYAFRPYDIQNKKAYPFIEVPLHVMDSTFRNYIQLPTHETANSIIRFLEKNSTHCILSILWHNTFFTNVKYEGYRAEYAKILAYLQDKKMETIDLTDLELMKLV